MEKYESNVAFIIKIINEICGNPPGKKQLQKMVYLIQHKGINLGFDYGLHFYGPYSTEVDMETRYLSSEGVIDFKYSRLSHLMIVDEEYCEVSSEVDEATERDIELIVKHFGEYETVKLELLTTAIYVYENVGTQDKKSIIKGVKKIKGEKYSTKEIEDILKEFKYFGYQLN